MVVLRRLTIHGLAGARNDEEAVFQALGDHGPLSQGLRLDGPGVEFIVGSCEPATGSFSRGRTEVTMADQVLKVFEKIHVLPYQDTFRYNYDYLYHEHIVPYFHTRQTGEITEGFDFAHDGVRFNVIGVLPDKSYGVVGQSTQIFYEGPPVERKVLERLQVVPFEQGLPEKYRPTKLSLDGDALLRDYLRPYFEQRSAHIGPGEEIPINGVTFKVVGCRPGDGGGVGKDTELLCQGLRDSQPSVRWRWQRHSADLPRRGPPQDLRPCRPASPAEGEAAAAPFQQRCPGRRRPKRWSRLLLELRYHPLEGACSARTLLSQ